MIYLVHAIVGFCMVWYGKVWIDMCHMVSCYVMGYVCLGKPNKAD